MQHAQIIYWICWNQFLRECVVHRNVLLLFWSPPLCALPLQTLALLCERYHGEKLLCCQQTLGELGCVQERWLNMSLQLFKRHPSANGEAPRDQQTLRELYRDLSDLLNQLEKRVSGASGEAQFWIVFGDILSEFNPGTALVFAWL